MKLELGYKGDFEIRKYSLVSEKVHGIRIIYLSDFHFSRFSENILNKVIAGVKPLNPNIILLGGDYVDSNKGLLYFEYLIKALSGYGKVFAIEGNHDKSRIEKIKKIIIENEVEWLEGESVKFELKGFSIQIDGGFPMTRAINTDLSILVLHKPIDITPFGLNYNLAFAGHLHGSQIVLWKNKQRLFPGSLFYKWNRLDATLGECCYIISKGLGDTLPIRYNCRKDIIHVEIILPS